MTTRSRSLRTALLSLAVASGLVLTGPMLASAQGALRTDDVTWGVRTASNEYGTARSNFTYAIEPGQTLTDALVITNHDAVDLDLDVYAADAFTSPSGELTVLTRDESSQDAGLWVTMDRDHVKLTGGEVVEVPFTVTIPENATPGDYAAGIVTSLTREDAAEGIDVDRRLGVRIYFRVGGVVHPDLTVENMSVRYDGSFLPFAPGSATVTYTVRNTGNVRLASQTAAATSGPFGLFTVSAIDVAPVPELLPGESWDVEVPIDGVPATFWVGAEVKLTPIVPALDGAPEPPAAPEVTAQSGTWGIPWSTLVLLLIIAIAVVVTLRLRRRRKVARAEREAALVAAAVESALREAGVEASPTEDTAANR